MNVFEHLAVIAAEESAEIAEAALKASQQLNARLSRHTAELFLDAAQELCIELTDLRSVILMLEEQGLDLAGFDRQAARCILAGQPGPLDPKRVLLLLRDLMNASFLVNKALSKMLRFGTADINPTLRKSATHVLIDDLNRLDGVVLSLWRAGVPLMGLYSPGLIASKRAKVEKYMDYAASVCGSLQREAVREAA